jgi:hypothetical protein
MVPKGYSEDDIADAIFAITDKGLSQNQAALCYGVPRSTIQSSLNGQRAEADQIQSNQRIAHDEEVKIRNWALWQESLGYGLSHNQIRAGVEVLFKQRGDNTPLGMNWVNKFVNKYSELKTKIGRVQETVRSEAFTPKAVN